MSAGTELKVLDSKWTLGCLVTVKAQVMTRDDSTGMWVPLSGGGMSVVSLHRVLTPRADNDGDDVTYVILGQRIADRSVALNCELLSDFQYTSVNPTFHHWTTDNRRFGLTFQTSSDATAFHRGIQKLQQKMRLEDSGSDPQLDKKTQEITDILQDEDISMPSRVLKETEEEPGNSDTFTNEGCSTFEPKQAPKTTPRMPCITPQIFIKQPQLPATQLAHLRTNPPPNILSQVPPPVGSSSPPGVTDKTRGITLGDYGFYVDVSTNSVGLDGPQGGWLEGDVKDIGQKVRRLSIPSDEADDLIYFSGSYVQFARNDPEKHDYCYPSLDTFKFPPYGTMPRSPYAEPQQVRLSTPVPVPIPIKSRHRWLRWKRSCAAGAGPAHLRPPQKPVRKSRCAYCDEFFTPEENFRGACKDAPDRILACIKAATCVCCRDAVLYHCKGGEDDDNAVNDELDCRYRDRRSGGGGGGSCRRRVITILICLVVPCLWCYLPLRACHRVGVSCQCCGPRHKAAR